MNATTILVVDDSTAMRSAIRGLLEPLGFTVLEAADGALALQLCEEGTDIDAILLDIEMPVLDGLEFLDRLRHHPWLQQPPVVMCSTLSSVAQIQRALDAGADEYIMKPFDADILELKLAEIGIMA